MKNYKRIFALLLVTLLVSAPYFLGATEAIDKEGLGKTANASTGKFDGNRIDDDLENNGMIVSHRPSGHSGMEWPAGNGTYSVYASGVWLAGKVGGEIRTAVAEYGPEFNPGPYGSDPNDANGEYVLYKVNKTDLDNPADNPDFANWPVQDGAPWIDVDGNGTYEPMPGGPDHPEFIGDQVIFYVMNDGVASNHDIFSTEPLGLEIRMTIWGYNRADYFGDMMFTKAQIYNKGGNNITDAYLGIWSDPDLGNAGDDFVGCDLDLSLGYCYNDGEDNAYGYAAPAVGYDFFQAAFPTGDPNDQQYCFGELKTGYTGLPMTSFVKYINSDDVYTDPNDEQEAYNYMSGYKRDGSPFINSATGEATKFVHPDDPNLNIDGTDNIWVDGDDNAADDRRFLMNVGPFNFSAGDSAEVVFGILHAQGSSALGSVSLLKYIDKFAQSAYDANFDLPPAPPIPELTITSAAGTVVLEWEDNAEDYSALVAGNNSYYNFEGYNIYMHETAIGVGEKQIVATYDLKNGITTIKDDVYLTEYNDVVTIPTQVGTDTGIKRSIAITTNHLLGGIPLIDDRAYYFSVTAYGYNGFATPRVLESSSPIWVVRPQTNSTLDVVATMSTSFETVHTADGALSDGEVTVQVINPSKITGDEYEVSFTEHTFDVNDGPMVVWNIENTRTGEMVLENQTIQSGVDLLTGEAVGADHAPSFDGMLATVNGPANGFHGVFIVHDGTTDRSAQTSDIVEASVLMEDVWHYGWNLDEFWPLITHPDGGRYWVTQGGGTAADNASYVARVLRNNNADWAIPYDFEWRWLGDGDSSWGIWYGIETDVAPVKVPFEIWNIGIGTPDDPSDDVQMIPRIYDVDANGKYNWQGDVDDSSLDNDAHTDWVYWWSLADGSTWADFEAAAIAGDASTANGMRGHEVLARTIFMNHNGAGGETDSIANSMLTGPNSTDWTAADTALFLDQGWFIDDVNTNAVVEEGATHAYGFVLPFPEAGSVYRWITNKPNALSDKFTFTTDGFAATTVAFDPENIKVWPNPYFGYNPEERTPLENNIHFINLPEVANIKIYSLAGQLVRHIEHNGGQEEVWNGQNSFNVLVASGVYIAVIDTKEGEKVLKLAVVMPQQRLDVY